MTGQQILALYRKPEEKMLFSVRAHNNKILTQIIRMKIKIHSSTVSSHLHWIYIHIHWCLKVWFSVFYMILVTNVKNNN